MSLNTKLKEVLEGMELQEPRVEVSSTDRGKVLATVVSPSFVGLNEARRQELVWQEVLDRMLPEDQIRIEFIFTNAPEEAVA